MAVESDGTLGTSISNLCTFILLFDGFFHYCGIAFGKVIKNRPLEDYGKIERAFRKFDGRKNSYIIFILIGVLVGVPFYSLIAVTLWSFISAVFYSLRAIKHMHAVESGKHYIHEFSDSKTHRPCRPNHRKIVSSQ